MAEDNQDESSKTEEPTQRRLEEALKKGQVASSREVNHFLILFAFSMVILWLAPYTMEKITSAFSAFIISPHQIEVSEESTPLLLREVVENFFIAMLPIIVISMAAALAAGLLQHRLIFSAEPIKPKLEKISILKGFKRLFSMRSLTEFVKGIIKISLVGLVAYIVLSPMNEELDFFITFEIHDIIKLLHSTSVKVMIGVLSFMMVVAVLDFMYQRFEHHKNLRMSRHDIKEEMRQSEGDPHIKARLKQIRMERMRKRMMAEVPKADVVITNPTHFSIALKYEQKTMAAPVVIAKGMDNIALKIREIAKDNGIPLVENPTLARALYDAVNIDEEIPLEFYQAVAEVISYVFRMKNKKAA